MSSATTSNGSVIPLLLCMQNPIQSCINSCQLLMIPFFRRVQAESYLELRYHIHPKSRDNLKALKTKGLLLADLEVDCFTAANSAKYMLESEISNNITSYLCWCKEQGWFWDLNMIREWGHIPKHAQLTSMQHNLTEGLMHCSSQHKMNETESTYLQTSMDIQHEIVEVNPPLPPRFRSVKNNQNNINSQFKS